MEQDEQRQYKRHSFRLPCTFRILQGEQVGFITNLSARGFFIQTRSKADADADIIVQAQTENDPMMIITGTVVRERRSHRSMAAIEQPGIGVKIETAPESFYQLVLEMEEKGSE